MIKRNDSSSNWMNVCLQIITLKYHKISLHGTIELLVLILLGELLKK
jgi:hypothetical protein